MAVRFTERAVTSLHAYIKANYPTFLRGVETELGLDSGDLPNPVDYVKADLPFDNRNPRVDVFDENMSLEDHHESMVIVDVECSVVWSYSGHGDLEAGELLARQCLTAMIKCLYADRSLGGTVKAALLDVDAAGSTASMDEDKVTRHVFQIPVLVTLQEDL